MGRHVARQTPKGMPTFEQVQEKTTGIPKPFLVAGSRGQQTRDNREPAFDVHANFRFVAGNLEELGNKHVIFFVHGYNVTTSEGLTSAHDFFKLLATSLAGDDIDLEAYVFLLFTWPGDTGTIHFNDAQKYAQHSGVALFRLLQDSSSSPPHSVSIVTHSLGAHVALRALAVLGERRFRERINFRVDRVLLLGAAVEDDVFSRPSRLEEYHFPEAAFGMKFLHMVISRDDDVLGGAFRVNELDRALGFSGPETMSTLVSLARRVKEVLGEDEVFRFELHDFTPSSATIMDPELHVHSHGGYWKNQSQMDYYVNLLKHG